MDDGVADTPVMLGAGLTTVVVKLAPLLNGFGSGVSEVAFPDVDSVIPFTSGQFTPTVTASAATSPAAIDAFEHVIAPLPPIAGVEHAQPAGAASDANPVFAGTLCVTTTLLAAAPPWLVAVNVYASALPAVTFAGAAAEALTSAMAQASGKPVTVS